MPSNGNNNRSSGSGRSVKKANQLARVKASESALRQRLAEAEARLSEQQLGESPSTNHIQFRK